MTPFLNTNSWLQAYGGGQNPHGINYNNLAAYYGGYGSRYFGGTPVMRAQAVDPTANIQGLTGANPSVLQGSTPQAGGNYMGALSGLITGLGNAAQQYVQANALGNINYQPVVRIPEMQPPVLASMPYENLVPRQPRMIYG